MTDSTDIVSAVVASYGVFTVGLIRLAVADEDNRPQKPPSRIPAGSWFAKTDHQLRTLKQGARFICHSNDCTLTQVFGTLRKV